MHPNPNALELTCYGNGYAWLRPDEPRYTLTGAGRRALAIARFLERGPTIAEVSRLALRPSALVEPLKCGLAGSFDCR